jgi:hypothetical protein
LILEEEFIIFARKTIEKIRTWAFKAFFMAFKAIKSGFIFKEIISARFLTKSFFLIKSIGANNARSRLTNRSASEARLVARRTKI